VLQRRRNHGTFKVYRVEQGTRPDLLERFRVETLPTLMVLEDKAVRARLAQPRNCRDIERFLSPWLV
jgi:thioredoxin-like negative regulator of GroEL